MPILVVTYTLVVPGKSMPWSVPLNPAYAYGLNDGTPPTFVTSTLVPGQIVEITASGFVTPSDSRPPAPPNGTPPPTGSTGGSTHTGFPTKYMPGSLLGLAALVGMFSVGSILKQPLSIGASASFVTPVGVSSLYMGTNDDHYSDNTGQFFVTVKVYNPTIPEQTHVTYFDFGA